MKGAHSLFTHFLPPCREDGERLIELFAEVALPKEVHGEAFILQTYPREYANKEILSSVPSFAYPCTFRWFVASSPIYPLLTSLNPLT